MSIVKKHPGNRTKRPSIPCPRHGFIHLVKEWISRSENNLGFNNHPRMKEFLTERIGRYRKILAILRAMSDEEFNTRFMLGKESIFDLA